MLTGERVKLICHSRFIIISFILTIIINSYSEILTKNNAKKFMNLLLEESKDIRGFILDSEFEDSQRLKIKYKGIKQKFLIGYDIEKSIKERLNSRKDTYSIKIIPKNKDFSILKISVPKLKYNYDFYFYKQKLVSRAYFYTKFENWTVLKSKYFIFYLKNSNLTNKYAIKKLDKFVEKTFKLLKTKSYDITRLEKRKIKYFLCDENNIEKISGFNTKGIYIIAQDYIISTSNSHYHEVSHLLINYHLKKMNLYTLPLLQEGFAVAIGGRGEKNVNIIMNLGKFLIKSNFLTIKELLNKNNFLNMHSSLTYPVSGIFCKYYIDKYGIDSFLNLYKRYSTDVNNIEKLKISYQDLKIDQDFKTYLDKNIKNKITFLSVDNISNKNLILQSDENKIYETKNKYIFSLNSNILLSNNTSDAGYKSKVYKKIYKKSKYKNQKYMITFTKDEISVYNLFTNELIANYANGFLLDNKIVLNNESILFSIDKDIFDNSLKDLIISQ